MKIEISKLTDSLTQQATKRSRYWLLDAVANKRDNAGDDLSEAADDFVRENGKGSWALANAILESLGEDPLFNQPNYH